MIIFLKHLQLIVEHTLNYHIKVKLVLQVEYILDQAGEKMKDYLD